MVGFCLFLHFFDLSLQLAQATHDGFVHIVTVRTGGQELMIFGKGYFSDMTRFLDIQNDMGLNRLDKIFAQSLKLLLDLFLQGAGRIAVAKSDIEFHSLKVSAFVVRRGKSPTSPDILPPSDAKYECFDP